MTSINNILANGTKVVTVVGKIEALIISVSVVGETNSCVEYQIRWFSNGTLQSAWVSSFEVEEVIDNSRPAGFTRPSTNDQKLIK